MKDFLYRFAMTRYLTKSLLTLYRYGFRYTMKKSLKKLKLLKRYDYTKITSCRRQREESTRFDKDIKFSILVPLYNTPEKYLKEMIDSVVNQTYKNWELCLADGSDEDHKNVEQCVQKYSKKDKRIIYKKLEKNLGISGNTNACIEMSSGDYISLFDHDDLLHPSALFENMLAICNKNADFIYTDEAVFISNDINKIMSFHFKPDYAIDNLRANNYICHFSSFSRELLNKAGAFRSEFDGSQDHDIILRLSSIAQNVYHIPKVLYFWRSHPGSVAADIGTKLYAVQAGRSAVAADIISSGYNAVVDSSKISPTVYKISYELVSNPLVSIVITSDNNNIKIKKCVESLIQKTTYKNYEIVIVVDNGANINSAYYNELKNNTKVRFVTLKDSYSKSAANNFGALSANGEYLVFLNKYTTVLTENWIEEMLMYAQRTDVGAVGAKLYFKNDTVRRAGMVLGYGKYGTVGLIFHKFPKESNAHYGKLFYSQNLSAVSDECLMIRKQLFIDSGCFNESFSSLLCPADLCLRLKQKGYLTVFTPYAELYYTEPHKVQSEMQKAEHENFKKLWAKQLESGDPYYNPNLSLSSEYDINFSKLQQDCCE